MDQAIIIICTIWKHSAANSSRRSVFLRMFSAQGRKQGCQRTCSRHILRHIYTCIYYCLLCAIIMEWSVIFDACFNCMRLNKTVGLNQSTDTFWSMCAEAVTVLRPQGVNTVCIKEVTKESFKSSVDTRSTHILLSLAVIPSTRGRRYRI